MDKERFSLCVLYRRLSELIQDANVKGISQAKKKSRQTRLIVLER